MLYRLVSLVVKCIWCVFRIGVEMRFEGDNQACFWMKSASVLKEMFQKDFLRRVWILNRVLACGKNGRRCYISLKILKIDCHVQILRFLKDACRNKIKKKFTQRIVITFYILRNSTHLQFLINNISYAHNIFMWHFNLRIEKCCYCIISKIVVCSLCYWNGIHNKIKFWLMWLCKRTIGQFKGKTIF